MMKDPFESKYKKRDRKKGNKKSKTFLYLPVVHLNVFPEAFSPSSYSSSSLLHLSAAPTTSPLTHGCSPSFLSSHCHVHDSGFTHLGKQKKLKFFILLSLFIKRSIKNLRTHPTKKLLLKITTPVNH